jgi:hypothetical protein
MGRFAEAVLGIKRPKPLKSDQKIEDRANEIVRVNDSPYFKDLLTKVEEAAMAPIDVSNDSAKMAASVGKQAAYRELLAVLKKELETAQRILAQRHDRRRDTP